MDGDRLERLDYTSFILWFALGFTCVADGTGQQQLKDALPGREQVLS